MLASLTAVTLTAATVSCLVGPQHPFHLNPCYWDVAQLPSRLVLAILHAIGRSIVAVVGGLL